MSAPLPGGADSVSGPAVGSAEEAAYLASVTRPKNGDFTLADLERHRVHLEEGRKAHLLALRGRNPAKPLHVAPPPPRLDDLAHLGGKEGFIKLFFEHYQRMFCDPLLSVLFDLRDPDTAVGPEVHGRRLGLYLLGRWVHDDGYSALRPGSSREHLGRAHVRAKRCPMRPGWQKVRGDGFTKDQRDTWIGIMVTSARSAGASPELVEKLVMFLVANMGPYGPFQDAQPDGEDDGE